MPRHGPCCEGYLQTLSGPARSAGPVFCVNAAQGCMAALAARAGLWDHARLASARPMCAGASKLLGPEAALT